MNLIIAKNVITKLKTKRTRGVKVNTVRFLDNAHKNVIMFGYKKAGVVMVEFFNNNKMNICFNNVNHGEWKFENYMTPVEIANEILDIIDFRVFKIFKF